MRLTILGGGGFRVPLVHGALLSPASPITELVLYDVDAGRLAAISRVLAAQGDGPRRIVTTNLDEALTGADFVFSAIRVQGLEGRVVDEQVALSEGVLGQETTGAGGVAFGLRTVPVAVEIARRIAVLAPSAWVINFTNPAGLVTEAMAAHLGDRVIGICDTPSALVRRVLRALDLPGGTPVRYAGLNHLGWLSGVYAAPSGVSPELVAGEVCRIGGVLNEPSGTVENCLDRLLSGSSLESFEEGRLFGADRLRSLGAIPNEYLHYYYDTAATVAAEQRAPETRGAFLLRQQASCYAALESGDPLTAWTAALRQRDATYMSLEGLGDRPETEGGGYEAIALALMRAIALNRPARLILNVRNRGTLDFLDDDAVIEVPCAVSGAGARPLPGASVPGHGIGLVTRIKQVERGVMEACSTGSRAAAVRAMAAHPLVDSEPIARRLIAKYQERLPALAYLV